MRSLLAVYSVLIDQLDPINRMFSYLHAISALTSSYMNVHWACRLILSGRRPFCIRSQPSTIVRMRTTQSDGHVAARSTVTAAICWLLAAVVYLLAEAVAATAFPDYSYAANYISDLGVPDVEMLGNRHIDSPLHVVINIAFIVHGILFAIAALCLTRGRRFPLRRTFVALTFVHALGMVLIAMVNGGQHNYSLGLAWVHLLGAFFAFFGGHLSAICIGISLLLSRRSRIGGLVSIGIGLIGILGIVMLQADVRVVPGTLLPDGVWERIGMYAIVAWEVTAGIVLLSLRHSQRPLSQSHSPALD